MEDCKINTKQSISDSIIPHGTIIDSKKNQNQFIVSEKS